MAHDNDDSSGEDFGTTGSDSDDEDEGNTGMTFFLAAKTWSSEQRKILKAHLEDWKVAKSSKSQNLVIQGALSSGFWLV